MRSKSNRQPRYSLIAASLLFFLLSSVSYGSCIVRSCDRSISYAIGRYGDKVSLRLKNLVSSVREAANMEEILYRVNEEKLVEYVKYRERLKIELMEARQSNVTIDKIEQKR